MATNGNFAHQEQHKGAVDQYAAAPASIDAGSSSAAGSSNLSKDEVGWYFVEQYYTTLSKSPEKLHLFYGKRSQFVYGLEAQVANVSVGRQAIQERIKQLDFQDCKVRVSNVDSQASFDNIVIQVIGETSNKASEPKKFVQTFVLAQQPSGYFVLNDILRYIEEGDEEPVEITTDVAVPESQAPASGPVVPVADESVKTESVVDEPSKLDAKAVDEKLEDVSVAKAANGGKGEAPVEAAKAAESQADASPAVDPATAVAELTEEDVKVPEKPKDPSPTPATKAAAPVQAPAAPAEPTGPPKPMTWASRAAAAAGPRPVVPLPKTATPPAPSQSRAPAPAAAPATTAAQSSAAAPAAEPTAGTDAPVKEAAAGWQTAGNESKRQNRPQSISGGVPEKEGTMGYVKYVTDKVQEADLRGALAAHGELTYFDINRQKNCAFVEYKSMEGYQAAVTANPHIVNGENIVVEPRRPKSTAYGGSNYGSGRGGSVPNRGRGGFDGNRGGGQGNARGNFSGQNRGRGGGGARGRGGAQPTSA